jgi:hypothetical protein
MTNEATEVTLPHDAVIHTSPARTPLHISPTSYKGFFLDNVAVANKAVIPPDEAATIVFTDTIEAIPGLDPVIDRVEPALKPNQPNHKIKVPITYKGTLWPLKRCSFPFVNLPVLGPAQAAPINPDNPPTICTIPLPAKS